MSAMGGGAGPAANGRPGMTVPRLRPGLTIIPGGEDGSDTTWVTVNSRVLRLRGETARRLLAAIDGTRTLEEVAAVVGAAGPDGVSAAIDRLRGFGILEPEGLGAPAPLLRALADQGADPGAVAAELGRARVAVVADGILGRAVAAALGEAGIGEVRTLAPPSPDEGTGPPELDGADMAVVALDAADPEALAGFNALALRLDLPWIAEQARGLELRLGPFVIPRRTACWSCFERRLEANDPGAEERQAVRAARRGAGVPHAPADDLAPGIARLGAEVCALEAVLFFAARVSDLAPGLHGAFADYSLLTHRSVPHPVLRLPRCPDCGVRASGRPTVRAWMEPYGYPDGG